MSNSGYIADLQRKVHEASRKAALPEAASGAIFSIGAGEMAAGGGQPAEGSPKVNVRRHSTEPWLHQALQKDCQQPQADAGAGGRRSVTAQVPKELLYGDVGAGQRGTPPSLHLLQSYGQNDALRPSVADMTISEHDSAEESSTSELPSARAEGNYDEVASEVLRLRKLRQSHQGLQTQLVKANERVRKLPPHSLLQFHGYLEKAMAEPGQVQQPIIKLIESLCAVCRVDIVPCAAQEEVLMGVRRLLRDPHNFATKLSKLAPLTSDDAKSLAPCLLSADQYRKVRDKDAHMCCEALFQWVTAYYYLSDVADQVEATQRALDINERRLRELEGIPRRYSSSPGSPNVRPIAGLASLAQQHAGQHGAGHVGASRLDSGRRGSVPSPPAVAGHGVVGSGPVRCAAGSPRQKASPRRICSADPSAVRPGTSGASAAPQAIGSQVQRAETVSGSHVKRMQSDKALTQVFSRLRKDKSADSVAADAAAAHPHHHHHSGGGGGGASSDTSRPSGTSRVKAAFGRMMGGGGGAAEHSQGAHFAPQPRMSSSRQTSTGATLPTVPERMSTLPVTLLESLSGGHNSPSAPGGKRLSSGGMPALGHDQVKRSSTASSRLQ